MSNLLPRLSVRLAFITTMLMVSSCVTVDSPNRDSVLRKVEAVNKILEGEAFQTNGQRRLTLLEDCRISFSTIWSKHVSKMKGYAAVSTVVDVDFAKNVDGAQYRAAFEVESEGYTQRWGAGVWLELFSDVTGEFNSRPIRGADFEARPYDVDFVLFGVERAHAPEMTEQLVALLNELNQECS